jgi:predicted naringenin-chalcone synthase
MKLTDSLLHLPGERHSTRALRDVLAAELDACAQVARAPELFGDAFYARLGVAQRHLVVDPTDPAAWWRAQQGRSPIAHEGARAYRRLMQRHAPLQPHDRLVVVANVFDTTAPGLAVGVLTALAQQQPGFVQPSLLGLAGEGCSGFVSALREADLWLRVHPRARVVIVCCEISSPYFWSPLLQQSLHADDVERRRGLLIQRLLFGDACVAALCASDSAAADGIALREFRRWTNLDVADRELLKLVGIGTEAGSFPSFGFFEQQPKRLLERLSCAYLPRARAELAACAPPARAWALHTGSGAILDLVQDALRLDAAQVEPSRAVLRQFGNLNSATGAAVLHALREAGATERVCCAFFGVGFTLQLAWG